MTVYGTFVEKWNALAKLLREKPYVAVPDKVWEKPAKDLDKLLSVLDRYYTEPKVPTKAEIKAVKEHGITAQIKVFIDKDKERKSFFTVEYFQKKCATLSDRDLVQALPKGTTRAAYLTAYLVYNYWMARPDPSRGLERVRAEIEGDFRNSPAAKQSEQAKSLYRELLGESDLDRLVAVLQSNFPDKTALSTFAKTVGLRIPAGKKPIHQRLAAKIMASGELVRAKF